MVTLFDSLELGNHTLSNRIIMAPMTRGRAQSGAVPGKIMVDYYAARAKAGLIITEATAISPQGYGWLNAPGIWNDEQEQGWRAITKAVHAQGGRIFLQLWHMGRVSHPDFLQGQLPVAPSAIAAKGEARTSEGTKPYVTPHALSVQEIKAIISDYANAAQRAVRAGFDGIELHAANGYLVDQFIRDGSNQRTDEYGGSIENRLRFLLEIIETLVNHIGSEKIGVRLSPTNPYNDMHDSNPMLTFTKAAQALNAFDLAYIHTMEPLPGNSLAVAGEHITPHMRKIYQGTLITNGGYDKNLATQALESNTADAIAFGLPFLANPDLVLRFKENALLNQPDFATLYTPGEKGYNDYKIIS